MGSNHLLDTGVSVLIIIVCLFVSAFFSLAETAITSLGTLKTKHLIDIRGQSLNYMKLWVKHPGRVLATILLFNNVVNILASSVATQLAYQHFESGAIGIATGITTLLVLVFGEITPKSFAKAYAERVALISMRVIVVAYYVAYPFIRLLSGFADYLIRLVSKGRKHEPLITEAEIEFLVNEGEKAGVIKDIKRDIIEGAFDFDETKVREIMTPRTDITAFNSDAAFDEILDIVIKTGHSRFPVYKHHIDHIVGVILAKDLLTINFAGREKAEVHAKDLMREALFAPESKSIMGVFKDLKRSKSHLAVIIDEYGGTAGIVTMEDILEEIVGEIQDEFDTEEAKFVQISDRVFEVSGAANVEEFLHYFDLDERDFVLDQDADTIAGWITQQLGQIPKTGQTVTIPPFKMEVIEVRQRRIKRVRVEKVVEDMSDNKQNQQGPSKIR